MPDPESNPQDIVNEDSDPQETREWLEALDAVFEREGVERAHFLIGRMVRRARRKGAHLPYRATTAYINTISEALQKRSKVVVDPRAGQPELWLNMKALLGSDSRGFTEARF